MIYLLLAPEEAFQAASDGLLLWFYTILPSLLPFIILSNFLISTKKIPALLHRFSNFFSIVMGLSTYGAYTMILGLFCGYPMGAKVTGDLYREKLINIQEASYLLTFTNNPSPMFISSFLLGKILQKPKLYLQTLLILYLAVFCTSFLFRLYYHRFENYAVLSATTSAESTNNYFSLMDFSIMNGFETITKLGGYIILFSIVASLLQHIETPVSVFQDFLPGIIELSTGVVEISKTSYAFSIKYIAILMCISFGSISTILQTKGMLFGTPLSLKPYIIGKIIHTIFTQNTNEFVNFA